MMDNGSALREQPVVRRVAPSQDIHTSWDCHAVGCAQLAPSCKPIHTRHVAGWPQTQFPIHCIFAINKRLKEYIVACLASRTWLRESGAGWQDLLRGWRARLLAVQRAALSLSPPACHNTIDCPPLDISLQPSPSTCWHKNLRRTVLLKMRYDAGVKPIQLITGMTGNLARQSWQGTFALLRVMLPKPTYTGRLPAARKRFRSSGGWYCMRWEASSWQKPTTSAVLGQSAGQGSRAGLQQ